MVHWIIPFFTCNMYQNNSLLNEIKLQKNSLMVTSTKVVLISTGQQYTKQYCTNTRGPEAAQKWPRNEFRPITAHPPLRCGRERQLLSGRENWAPCSFNYRKEFSSEITKL